MTGQCKMSAKNWHFSGQIPHTPTFFTSHIVWSNVDQFDMAGHLVQLLSNRYFRHYYWSICSPYMTNGTGLQSINKGFMKFIDKYLTHISVTDSQMLILLQQRFFVE